MPRRLSAYEQETIINLNKAEDIASIFTYEKTWKTLGREARFEAGYGQQAWW